MKRTYLVTLSIALLCILSSTAFASAASAEYGFTNYQAITVPTTDGTHTTGEWLADSDVPPNLLTTFAFREKWSYPESKIYLHVLIEFFTDNTNDAGDYYQVCYDCSADGGTAPKSDDVKIEWKGHSTAGYKIYTGTGTGWAAYTGAGAVLGTDVVIAESLSTSPLSSTTHWVVEMKIYRSGIFDVSGAGYAPLVSLAVYDASNSAAGIQAWPSNSVDKPDNWAVETGTMDNIPESLTVLSVIALSTFAIVTGTVLLRKHPSAIGKAFKQL
ncbi:hypothetical protein GX563_01555 [Candidatus Bathyarchaeota archaeon]|nr:hypothetical protein [Candidatus Bathyarchaeota archaeon]